MTSAAETPKISAEDFLTGETASPIKHEYLGGDVFSIAEATAIRNPNPQ